MRWRVDVELEWPGDPGAELVQVLRSRFGSQVRTRTVQAWLVEQQRAEPEPFRVRPSQFGAFGSAEHSYRMQRRKGKGTQQ